MSKRTGKRLLKFLGFFLVILMVLLTAFHFWFKAHARQLLEDLVESRSNGKLKLKLGSFSFNYFSNKMKLEKAVFYTDSTDQITTYHFEIEKINLKAKAILPIIFRNEFMIDSIRLINPVITVTRLRPLIKPGNEVKKDVSIPEEMGKVYTSIQDAMKILSIIRFDITNGTFNLVNKIDISQLPLSISNIYFHIDNFQVDKSLSGTEKILFSDNVILRSYDQNIVLPDGRHSLSFSRFNINLAWQLVEFDSCTIAATRGDSSAASFQVFFDKLQLINIDFDTLYKAEVIKADSVYCLNPAFNLEVEIGKNKGAGPPKLENIIEQLTGDLLLENVVVKNASINIKTLKDGVPSTMAFSNNNFEMRGLKVEQLSPKPVSVRSFSMAIRNYENFIRDSMFSVNFDSVVFRDDRITLSNFLFNKLNNGRILNTFSIPQFNLSGLSWNDLVFENKLKADYAIMFKPYINYTASDNMKRRGGLNVFQSLGVLNEYMDIQQLDIIEGNIDLKLKNNLRVQLDDATLSVKSHSLLESTKLSAIKNSLMHLRFDKGIINAGNFNLEIYDIDYQGESGAFHAGSIKVKNKGKTTVLEDIAVQKMYVDENSGDLYAEGVVWKKGIIRTDAFNAGGGNSSVTLRSVKGGNTFVSGPVGNKMLSASLQQVSFDLLEKLPRQPLKLEGLAVSGDNLLLSDAGMKLDVKGYNLADGKNSWFREVQFKTKYADIAVPELSLIPNVPSLIKGEVVVDEMNVMKPRIRIDLPLKSDSIQAGLSTFPMLSIANIRLRQPSIDYIAQKDSGTLSWQWQGEKNVANFLQAKGLKTEGTSIRLGELDFFLTDFAFTTPFARTFRTGDGKLAAGFRNIQVDKEVDMQADWRAEITNFEATGLRLDSIGKQKGNLVLDKANLKNLDIGSSLVLNLQKLVAANNFFRLGQVTGNYSDAKTNYTWHNLGFNRASNRFHADSISIIPAISQDSFIAQQQYEKDYLMVRSGAIDAGPVDIEKFIKEKILDARLVTVNNFYLYDYKDKRLPNVTGLAKPLPVSAIKSLDQKFNIDTMRFSNSTVVYTEVSDRTDGTGIIPITRMNVELINLKNYDLRTSDSLDILATGYLMDTAWIRFAIKESYTDSLGGFLMAVDMKPLEGRVFNPLLIPLELVSIESGIVDTLTMRAIGNEHMALGEMYIDYHGLKVRFQPKGEKKNSCGIKLKNFIANTFIVKNKSRSKNSIVFFIRNPNLSTINYFVKIALSGVTNGVIGASDKKLIRRYRNQLKERGLPEINFEERIKPF